MNSVSRRARTAVIGVAVGAVALSLAAFGSSASATTTTAKPTAKPAALDTCTVTTNAFVSLEVAPEVTSRPNANAGMYRLWDIAVAWKDVNPARGVFNWTNLDRAVAQAQGWGATPMLVLGLTPTWAAADPSAGDPRWGAGTASPPSNMDDWRNYIAAVVQRYGQRIGAYEVWNEANLQTFWTGTPAQMADMTKAAYDVIKQNNAGATVVAASVTTRLRSPMAKFMDPYVKALGDRGYPLDAWAIHTYPAGNTGPQQRVSDIRNWQQVVAVASSGNAVALNKQVWDTEVNYGLAGPGATPGTDFSDAQAADLITQTYADSLTLGIDATFWYQYTAAPQDLLGVQLWSGSPLANAAYNAARAKYTPGANFCNASGTSSGGGASSGSSSTSQSITIAPGRDGNKIVITGSSTGVAGQPFKVYLKIGKGKFKPLGDGVIASDGSIDYRRATTSAKTVKGYIKVGNVKSNTVTFP
jgi:hypothetical protein